MACKIESLYPSFGMAQLRNSRGTRFRALVDWVSSRSVVDPEAMAFTLMVRRIRRLTPELATHCHDPMCMLCAAEVVARYPDSDESLLAIYHQTLDEIETRLGLMRERAAWVA